MSLLYEPLRAERYEVRLLTLSFGSAPMVECTMQKYNLVHNPPPYAALSYCWGDEKVTRDIVVNGATISVTVNLEEALQRLRRMTGYGTMLLFADAICINQNDLPERSQQVRLMKQIYEKAEECYAWLGGQGFEAVVSGMISVKALVEASSIGDSVAAREYLLPACTGFLSICGCAYWQRRWIIQEITAASNVRLLCRTYKLELEILQSAYTECVASVFWLSEHQLSSAFLQSILQFRRRYHEGYPLSLCEVILETQQYLSKDPRDKIFALLGICSDGAALVPTPNYSQSVGENLCRFDQSDSVQECEL